MNSCCFYIVSGGAYQRDASGGWAENFYKNFPPDPLLNFLLGCLLSHSEYPNRRRGSFPRGVQGENPARRRRHAGEAPPEAKTTFPKVTDLQALVQA